MNGSTYSGEVSNRRDARHPSGETIERKRKIKLPKRKIVFVSIAIVVVAAISVVSGLLYMQTRITNYIDGNKYQAVFLTNGQVYFGKLQKVNGDYFKLKEIFYLENNSATVDDTNQDQDKIHLVKLGDEIHGPEDEMIVDKAQILFFENIKKDGGVSTAIKNYYADKK